MGLVLYYLNPRHEPARRELREGESWVVGSRHGFDPREMPPEAAEFTLTNGQVVVRSLDRFKSLGVAWKKYENGPMVLEPDHVVTVGEWEFFIGEGTPVVAFEPRSPREAELFHALETRPSDEETRQVYGDWLEENGHAREAEVLRIERSIWRTGRPDEVEQRRLGYRLGRASRDLPLAWRQVVTRPPIIGCGRTDCPRSWDRLAPKAADVRTCGTCHLDVRHTSTEIRASWERRLQRLVALDVSRSRTHRSVPEAPPPETPPLYGLPFFSYPDPRHWMSTVLERLRIRQPPNEAPLPVFVSPPAESALRSVFLRQRHEPFDGIAGNYREASRQPCVEIRLTFHGDGAAVERWLASHFGSPRVAGGYRVYGHWLFRPRAGHFVLWWFKRLPFWAADADPAVTLQFLRDLVSFLRTNPDFEAVKDFASRPPRRSGIVVSGEELDERGKPRERFYLQLEPTVDAIDVAQVIELENPSSWDDPYEAHWPMNGRGTLFGAWDVRAWLADRPRDVHRLSRRDHAIGLCIAKVR